uniref:ATP synthase F0 subunit 6 n=1 Tax=Multinervis guangxiensis TaxID=1792637 RepID=UPI003002896F|nr:ATP synthase F0 subunit 6 [Multinervis guangxiensis]
MMMNLFTVFDPCTGMLSLNWMSSFILFLLVPKKFWVSMNSLDKIMKIIIIQMNKEIKSSIKYNGSSLIFITVFLFILINNLAGMMPYVFTPSSQLVFSMSLAIPLWMSFMIHGWMNKTKSMFIHLVPMGTPNLLMPFMVLIETISNLIRPMSLAVRLSANMIAGHLLMSLLGSNFSSLNYLMLMSLFFMMLMVFEMAVAIIQSYVFMTLTTLYSSEI